MQKTIGFLFILLVLSLAGFAFSPRVDPPMPATDMRVDTLLMLDAVSLDQRLVLVGERGRIFFSDDGGHSWRPAATDNHATLTSVTRVDAQTLVAVGHDAVILVSRDRGESWTAKHADAEAEEPLLAVYFDETGRGMAVGAYGRFMLSDDAGESWDVTDVDELDLHFNALAGNGEVLILAGEAGTLLRSFDQGESWEMLDSPYEGSFFGALTMTDGSLLVFGMRGHVFRSEDAGDSWVEVDTGGGHASLFGGRVLSDGRVLLVGQSGVLLLSDDAGQSFKPLGGAKRLLRSSLIEVGAGEVLLLGEEGFERFRLPGQPGGES